MPFASPSDLPPGVRAGVPSNKQAQFVAVFNEVHGRTGSEDQAFKAAWAAVNGDRTDSVRHADSGTGFSKGGQSFRRG